MRHVTPLRLDRVARAVGSGDRDERLARERVAALSELTHPGLCVPLDVVREDDAVVVCSPRVPGVTLEDAGRCADPGEWVWLVVGIAEALAALHASGLTHGDIAPANVMIARAPVLVDLVGPSLGHERGTPGFAAPERAAGGPPSAADDVHALGAVALAAAPEGFRSDAEAWMAPLLARDPSVRPAAAAVARGLVRCAEPQPWRPDAAVERESGSAVADARTQRAPGAWRWALRRSPARVAAVAGLVAAAGGWWLWGPEVGASGLAATAPAASPSPTAPAASPAGVASSAVARPDPAIAAATLTAARVEALAGADAAALLDLTVDGSAARALAEKEAAQLRAGLRAEGIGLALRSATVVDEDGDRAVVDVDYAIAAHVWRAADGMRVEVPGVTEEARLTLAWSEGAWRVVDVSATP